MNTIGEAFDRYRSECLSRLGVRTRRDYVRHLDFLENYFGRDRVLATVKPRDVGRFLDVPTGKQHRNKQAAVLSAVFGKCVGKWYAEGCDANPCANVERHESHPRTRYIGNDEFWAVHAVAEQQTVRFMMELALLTGQRQGDLLDLTWHNIEAEFIRLTQGKTGKMLGIKLTPALKDLLQRIRYYKPFRGPRVYLIRARNGEPYTHEGFRALWQRTMNAAMKLGAIKTRFTFHDIRAKCASDKADSHSLQDASALLGHGDVGLTKRIYKRSITMVDPLR